MATKKTNGKRLSPSVERQIALALVRVIECVKAVDAIAAERSEKHELYEAAVKDREVAIDEAKQVLTLNGYGDLESRESRIAALELQLKAATELKQYKDLGPLSAALERARKGLPPLVVVEKKPKTASTERKPRIAKAVKEILDAFDNETLVSSDAPNHVVTSIKADDTGKRCLVQFDNNNEWIGVNPKDLKSITVDATKDNAS